MAYRVTFNVEPQLHDRDRITVFLRIILAVPHLVLVGGHGYREIAPVSGYEPPAP